MLIRQLNRVGEKTEKALKKLGLNNISDLVFYFPYRYEKYESCPKISSLKLDETINLKGTVEIIKNRRSFRSKMMLTEALISDDSGSLEVVWFNQPFIAKTLKPGDTISLAGKIKNQGGRLIMTSPIYEKINQTGENIHTASIVPVYSLTSSISQKQLRFLIHQSLKLIKNIPEYLPTEIIKSQKLLSLNETLQKIHFPKNQTDIDLAINRFKFSELFLFQLKSYLVKEKLSKKIALPIPGKISEIKKFIASLPYTLTPDQKKSAWEIIKDMQEKTPMSRLLQGDVGSGKTIVALLVAFNCIKNKKQVAFMAPTEVLAKQHYHTALKIFSSFNFKIALLTSKSKLSNFSLEKNKAKQIEQITKEADIVFGTHSLIQENIKFKNLALVVVDEQHLFGVNQRQEIINKNIDDNKGNTTPHFLSMTATPIPRSLALISVYGLNFSLISQKPQNRPEIITKVVEEAQSNRTYEFILNEINKGHQAFIICPLIDASDKLGAKSVKEEYEKLKKEIFPQIPMSILHGKMKSEEKDKVMEKFQNNEIKILISTSVVEVGIDVPNATVILIEGAERFGLAQLHQFRGRVGRSEIQSYCFLHLSEKPETKDNDWLIPNTKPSAITQRLEALQKYHDGLSLAKIDLKNRGSGNFYGTEQSGIMNFRFATLFDHEIINEANKEIKELTSKDPELKKHPDLLKKINSDIKKTHLE